MPDVLIVGAGPTGLLLAHQLRSRGLTVRLIDRRSGPQTGCRATSIQLSTARLLAHLGVVLAPVVEVQGTCTYRGDGQPPAISRHLVGYGCSQVQVENALRPLAGPIDWECELTGFAQDAEGVSARLSDGPLRCRYLVGCDGAHSSVRHGLGLGFAGVGHPEVFLVLDCQVEGPLDHDLQTVFLSETNTLTLLPLPGKSRYSLTLQDPGARVSTDHGLEAHDLPSPSEVEARLAFTGLGLRLGEVAWISRYRVSTRVADRYRVGRVFLAGDAAHIQSPKGGMGMNLGLFDAFNLGWKLADGRESWLASYESERRPVAERLGQLSDVLFAEQEEHQAGPVVKLRSAFEECVTMVDGPFGPGWTWRGPGPPAGLTSYPDLEGGLVRPDGVLSP